MNCSIFIFELEYKYDILYFSSHSIPACSGCGSAASSVNSGGGAHVSERDVILDSYRDSTAVNGRQARDVDRVEVVVIDV